MVPDLVGIIRRIFLGRYSRRYNAANGDKDIAKMHNVAELSLLVRDVISRSWKSRAQGNKKGEVVPHPECFHNGIILIVYVIQKSCAKIQLFCDICKYFCNFLAYLDDFL